MRERRPGVWELRVYVGRDPITNVPKQVSRTVRGGKRVAQTELAALVTEAKAGKLGGTDASVSVLFDRYFNHLERKGLSPTTLHAYRRYAHLHLLPTLGRKAVRKLTAWDLDGIYARMADAGKSPATVRQAHVIMSGALSQAVKWGWCPTNVARMASPPAARSQRIVPPTVTEVREIIAAAERRDPTMAAVVMLAALIGARRGELCALRWSDCDLQAGTVRIARSMLDLPGRVEEKPTKSHQERTLALGEAGLEILRLHRQQADTRAAEAGVELGCDAFIFSEAVDASAPVRPEAVTRFFERVRDGLGLRHVHFHSLRHFMATQLAARGDVSARTLAGRLGHADASVSLKVYSAFFPPADVEAADHVGRLLQP